MADIVPPTALQPGVYHLGPRVVEHDASFEFVVTLTPAATGLAAFEFLRFGRPTGAHIAELAVAAGAVTRSVHLAVRQGEEIAAVLFTAVPLTIELSAT